MVKRTTKKATRKTSAVKVKGKKLARGTARVKVAKKRIAKTAIVAKRKGNLARTRRIAGATALL